MWTGIFEASFSIFDFCRFRTFDWRRTGVGSTGADGSGSGAGSGSGSGSGSGADGSNLGEYGGGAYGSCGSSGGSGFVFGGI